MRVRSPRSGRSPGRRHSNSLQYSCLENPMDRGAWRAAVRGVPQSQTQLKQLSNHTQALMSCNNSLYVCMQDLYQIHFANISLHLVPKHQTLEWALTPLFLFPFIIRPSFLCLNMYPESDTSHHLHCSHSAPPSLTGITAVTSKLVPLAPSFYSNIASWVIPSDQKSDPVIFLLETFQSLPFTKSKLQL